MNGSTSGCQRILVVDDDPTILGLVRAKLSRAGFEVLTARSGLHALDLIDRRGLPHLALVDIVMPGMDGCAFCQTVHAYSDLPIIMLTAVDETETVMRCIEEFAEDYVTKPFSPRELVARVQRVLRRIGDSAHVLGPITKVDDRLAVDFSHQQAIVDEQPIALTPTETKLLYILMRNAGRSLTTDFLLHRLWPLAEGLEDRLEVHIRHLQTKIELNPQSPHILTGWGLGYFFLFGT